MTSTDTLTRIAERARAIAQLATELENLRAAQDADVITAYRDGTPITAIVAVDGRSRQMLHRLVKTDKK